MRTNCGGTTEHRNKNWPAESTRELRREKCPAGGARDPRKGEHPGRGYERERRSLQVSMGQAMVPMPFIQ